MGIQFPGPKGCHVDYRPEALSSCSMEHLLEHVPGLLGRESSPLTASECPEKFKEHFTFGTSVGIDVMSSCLPYVPGMDPVLESSKWNVEHVVSVPMEQLPARGRERERDASMLMRSCEGPFSFEVEELS